MRKTRTTTVEKGWRQHDPSVTKISAKEAPKPGRHHVGISGRQYFGSTGRLRRKQQVHLWSPSSGE
jgi:hypothetical protein